MYTYIHVYIYICVMYMHENMCLIIDIYHSCVCQAMHVWWLRLLADVTIMSTAYQLLFAIRKAALIILSFIIEPPGTVRSVRIISYRPWEFILAWKGSRPLSPPQRNSGDPSACQKIGNGRIGRMYPIRQRGCLMLLASGRRRSQNCTYLIRTSRRNLQAGKIHPKPLPSSMELLLGSC